MHCTHTLHTHTDRQAPAHLEQGEELRQEVLILQQRVEDALHLAAEDLAGSEGVLEAALGARILGGRLHKVPHLPREQSGAWGCGDGVSKSM
jgi:hypothetical protein